MKFLSLRISCIILISFALIYGLRADRILFLLPIATHSQKNVIDPLVAGLAERGHELTLVASTKSHHLPANVNVKEIVIDLTDDFGKMLPANPFEFRQRGKLLSILAQRHIWRRECELIYKHEYIQDLIRTPSAPEHKFDLIVMNGFFNQCLLGLVHALQAPFILVTSMASPHFITRWTGNYFPTSYVPLPFLDLSDRMTFIGRLTNFCVSYLANFLHDYAAMENQDLYRKHVGQQTPGLNAIGRNASLILSNEHFSITYSRPNLPDTIDTGGIHCRPAKNLTDDLANFINGHDFVYFSMGSIVRSTHLLEEHRKIFIKVFSRLKERVIWKWDDENMPDVPANVMVKNWLPQQDILGHPSIKLFITHGGLLSTQEAVYHGVPLLGIPFFVDQDLNMHHAEGQGYALTLEILNLTEEEFESSIRRMLSNSKYSKKAKELSTIFRDQIESPLMRALFWTEYVLRHKGAPHLRSAARDLNFAQSHSWDVIGFLCLLVLTILFVVKLIVFKMFKSIIACAYNLCLRKWPRPKQKRQ